MAELVTASLHKHRRTTLERIEKYISDTYFTDVNLRGKLYPKRKAIEGIYHWAVPGGEGKWQELSFPQIVAQHFKPTKVGDSFGPIWSTHWFKIEINVPETWIGHEVCLRWKSQSEAMVWSESGIPLQGLSTGISHQMRSEFRISNCWEPSTKESPLIYYIEMSCNNMFGAGKDGMINPPDGDKTFKLELAELCTVDKQVQKLLYDLEVLHDMAVNLEDDPRGYEALYCGNHMINSILQGNLSLASKIADNHFSKRNGNSAHTLGLMGHCHIDSAWLWPYSETIRKCARSWASTLLLMKDYPEMKFACSQAQQFDWVKKHYPDLYVRIKTQVQENRFIPVGGTWVEMDGLIPSGESFMRQFLYGQQFFLEEFGVLCKEFWLPDTFGYSAQIPQICKQFGISRFLTQKLSWSLVNKFPHHNFIWEGLDGSEILAHFPPGDSYEMNVKVKEAMKTVRNLEDKGRVSTSAFLYGYGDGGGGPTADMLERARRLEDLDGCPRMKHMSPDEFFESLEHEQRNLCRWVGELYLELHNGTYTSQAKTKKQNRQCEFALRDAELLLVVAAIKGYLSDEEVKKLQASAVDAWKKVLLNQFHDVLPGSSIGIVYRDSDQLYQEALSTAERIRDTTLSLILNGGSQEKNGTIAVVNTLPWPVSKVVKLEKESNEKPHKKRFRVDGTMQVTDSGDYYVALTVPGMGSAKLVSKQVTPVKVSCTESGNFILENEFIRAVVSKYGTVQHLKVIGNDDRDVFHSTDDQSKSGCGNQFILYDDVPLFWDAWDTMDYHLETANILNVENGGNVMSEVNIVESGPLITRLRWSLRISEKSWLDQDIEMTSENPYLTFHTRVHWHENHKFLKVSFNTALLTRKATFDTQFGHLERSTHVNTSWDSAKYEVCGHKWADLSEFDFGMSVFNDSKYGWSCRGNSLTLSLLRSPKAPDDNCDMGTHEFKYGLMPHSGTFQKSQIERRAYELNSELIIATAERLNPYADTWFYLDGKSAMIEAVKMAEKDPRSVVFRIFEMHGGCSLARLRIADDLHPVRVQLCDGLEEPITSLEIRKAKDSTSNKDFYFTELKLSPFKILNVLVTFSTERIS